MPPYEAQSWLARLRTEELLFLLAMIVLTLDRGRPGELPASC